MTDAGLVHLKGLTNLESLNLKGTGITDAGLVYLMGLTKLQRLNVGATGVTDEGVKQIKQVLPECEISNTQIIIQLTNAARH